MNNIETLAAYRSISNITSDMAAAARTGEWERVTILEQRYSALVAKLGAAQPAPLPPEMQRHKIELIHKILADDAEIRNHAEPWMSRLQSLLGNAGMERRVRQAYDPETGGA